MIRLLCCLALLLLVGCNSPKPTPADVDASKDAATFINSMAERTPKVDPLPYAEDFSTPAPYLPEPPHAAYDANAGQSCPPGSACYQGPVRRRGPVRRLFGF